MAILALVGVVVLILIWVLSKWARKPTGDAPPDPISPRDQAVAGEIAPSRDPIGTGDHAFAETIVLETRQSPYEIPDTGPVSLTEGGWWVLNPRSPFPLSVRGVDESTVKELKKILDTGWLGTNYRAVLQLTGMMTATNLRCKEIDAYVSAFRPRYLSALEEAKKSSDEWAVASELDRQDLLAEFRGATIESLDVRPNCDLSILFEAEPSDATVDDDLVKQFGWENVRLYVRYAGSLGKVRSIPSAHPEREGFESLSGMGLALRGTDIPLSAILEGLRLKDMVSLASDLNPPRFTRKSQAIEYLALLPDLRERLARTVAFRELFQLQPLPGHFGEIDLQKVSEAWRYVHEIANVITSTYISAGNHLRDMDAEMQSIIRGWEILTAGDDGCPYCIRAASRVYPGKKPPKVPQHIACRCTLVPRV